jgi:hypothetical protein
MSNWLTYSIPAAQQAAITNRAMLARSVMEASWNDGTVCILMVKAPLNCERITKWEPLSSL